MRLLGRYRLQDPNAGGAPGRPDRGGDADRDTSEEIQPELAEWNAQYGHTVGGRRLLQG